MRRSIQTLGVLLGLCLGASALALDHCKPLDAINLPDVTVTAITDADQPAAHCKLDGRIGKSIRFSVWLPKDWNGKFVMGGEGGFAGGLRNQALGLGVLQRGYATATTDTGHQAGGIDGRWALGDYEAIVNYGHLAVHRTAVVSKAIVEQYYRNSPGASYFFGCSNGGRQALIEAQRYPEDFDAIVAGAPALDFQGIGATFTWITQHMHPDPQTLGPPTVTAAHRKTLRDAIEGACDANDGLIDGVLGDPEACPLEPASLACSAGNTEGCLPPEAVRAVQSVYSGMRLPDGSTPYPGFPFGAEDVDGNGWGSWLSGGPRTEPGRVPTAAFGFGVGLMRYFVYQDPDWSYVGYDFGKYARDSAPVTAQLDASNPDLDAFRKRGGKLLMYHGWADVALSARMSTHYMKAVLARDPQAEADVRLFMMPGVLHCAGGDGASFVDWVGEIDRWYTEGEAPERIVARFRPGDASEGRPVCAWPRAPHYDGGDGRQPGSFTCR